MKKITFLYLGVVLNIYANDNCIYDVNKVIDESFLAHPSMKMSKTMIEQAQASIDGAFWNYFPTPSVELSKSSKGMGTVYKLTQPVWTGGKLDAQYNIAQYSKEESQTSYEENKYNLVDKILEIIYSYVSSKAHLKELNKGKSQLEGFLKMIDRRIKAGISSLSDKELLISRISQIESDINTVSNNIKTSKMQLELLMDKKLNCIAEIDLKDLEHKYNIELNIQAVRNTNPTLKKFDTQIKVATEQIKIAKSSFFPTVSIVAEHNDGSIYNDSSEKNSLVYISLTASTGAGLSAYSNYESERLEKNRIKLEKLVKQKEIEDEFVKEYNSFISIEKELKTLEYTVLTTSKVYESNKRLFLIGKKQWLNLVDSSRELMQVKIQYANLLAQYKILSYKISLKTGELINF